MKAGKVIWRLAEGLMASMAVWFLGWLLYDLMELWQYLTAFEYRNLLFLLVAVTCLSSFKLARRALWSKSPSENVTTKKLSLKHGANNPKPEWVKDLEDKVAELSMKVADMHAIGQIKKRRLEAEKNA